MCFPQEQKQIHSFSLLFVCLFFPRRSPEEGNGSPLQYSYLENFMDRGAWLATVYGVIKSRTWLSNYYTFRSWKYFGIISTSFWKYLDYDIIGIQRIYNKLYTLIYWACVCIQAVVTIKRVNKSIRPKYSHSPTCLSTAHSFQRNSNSQSTSSHCILVCTFQKYMQNKLCYT